jgi:hypothetical protein
MGRYEGSCLCGGVRYVINGELGPIVYCHCSMCRKAQGTAFAANAPVVAADWRIETGAELLSSYDTPDGKTRVFCSRCGSPLYSRKASLPGVLRLRIGTLDSEISERPSAHIFVGSKAAWDEICDGLPRYERFEPGRQTP